MRGRRLGALGALWGAVGVLASGCGSEPAAGPGAEAPRAEDAGRSAVPRPSFLPGALRPRPGETLGARVEEPIALRGAPASRAKRLARVGTRTEFDSIVILAVMEVRGRWLGVASPELGNGELGWVRADRVKLLREQWRIDVDLSERRATLLRLGKAVRSFPVAVGRPETDTPPGRYGVTDRLDTGGEGSPYGCCVLAFSGRQPDVPQEWPGGDRLAIHGTSDPSSVGLAASSGCLRASEETMRLLMAKVPLGSQVRIRR